VLLYNPASKKGERSLERSVEVEVVVDMCSRLDRGYGVQGCLEWWIWNEPLLRDL